VTDLDYPALVAAYHRATIAHRASMAREVAREYRRFTARTGLVMRSAEFRRLCAQLDQLAEAHELGATKGEPMDDEPVRKGGVGPGYKMVGRLTWGQPPFVANRGDDAVVWSCEICGASVADTNLHDEWHA